MAMPLSPERGDCMVSSNDNIVLSEVVCYFVLLGMENIDC